MSSFDDVCSMGEQLSSNTLLKATLLFKLIVCAVGNILFIKIVVGVSTGKQSFRWLTHPNARCIFFTHLFFTFVIGFSFLFISGYDLYRYIYASSSLSHEKKCAVLVMPLSTIFPIRVIVHFSILAQVFSIFGLSIERLYCSVNLAKYDRITAPKLGIAISIASVVYASAMAGCLAWKVDDWSQLVSAFTIRTESNKEFFTFSLMTDSCIVGVTLVLFHIVFHLNNSSKWRGLAVKLQQSENRRTSRILLPLFWIHFLVFLFDSIGLSLFDLVVFGKNGGKPTAVEHAVFIEIIGQVSVYGLLLSLSLLRPSLSPPASSAVQRLPSNDHYFTELRNHFDKGHRQAR